MIDKRKNSKVVRGFCALIILFVHLSSILKENFYNGLNNMGQFSVSIFIFYSAYNLMYSYINKEDFKKNFIKKKIIFIYLPFVISNILSIFINIIKDGEIYNIKTFILSLIGLKIASPFLWYVYFTLFLYFVFYFVNYFNNSKNKYVNTFLSLFITVIIYLIFKVDILPLKRTAPIFLGFIFCLFENDYIKIRDHKIFDYIRVFNIMLFLLSVLMVIKTPNITKFLITDFYEFLTTISLLILLVLYTYKYQFNNVLLEKINSISYELYIYHFIMFYLLSKLSILMNNYTMFIIVYLIVTFCFSYIIYELKHTIYNKITKKIVN